MIEKVEELTSPPQVGKNYLVPCVYSYNSFSSTTLREQFWPVFLPSHEDSEYFTIDGKPRPNESHHYHLDIRFTIDSSPGIVERKPGPIKVVYQERQCLQLMPILSVTRIFGKRFINDHRGKKLKCMRCPHKGINLASMEVIDGVITCPAHGLAFDAKTESCISQMTEMEISEMETINKRLKEFQNKKSRIIADPGL